MKGPPENDTGAAPDKRHAPTESKPKSLSSGESLSASLTSFQAPPNNCSDQDTETGAAAWFEFVDETEEPQGVEPLPAVLWRKDYGKGITVLRLPTHGPDRGAYQEHAVMWHGPRDERVIRYLRRLWARRLLPFTLLIIDIRPNQWELGFDLGDSEQLAKWQAGLDRVAWAFPLPLEAVQLSDSTAALADAAGLGLRYQDYAQGGGT